MGGVVLLLVEDLLVVAVAAHRAGVCLHLNSPAQPWEPRDSADKISEDGEEAGSGFRV